MGIVVSVVSQKGGVGKTTIAVNVAGELVARGYDVLLVDADPQASAAVWHDRGDGEGWPTVIRHTSPTLHKPGQVPRLAESYDWVIVDVPGKLSGITVSALIASDVALVPVTPSALDVEAAEATIEAAAEAAVLNDNLDVFYVLSMTSRSTLQTRDVRSLLTEPPFDAHACFESEVRRLVKLQECPNGGDLICQYDRGGAAHRDIRRVVDELLDLFEDEDEEDEES